MADRPKWVLANTVVPSVTLIKKNLGLKISRRLERGIVRWKLPTGSWLFKSSNFHIIVFVWIFDRCEDPFNHPLKVPLTRYSKVSPNCSQDSSGLSTTRDLDETRHLFRGLTATSEKTLRFNSRYAQILSRWEQSVKKTTEGERGGPWEDPRTKEGDVCIFAEKKNTTTLPFFSEWYK